LLTQCALSAAQQNIELREYYKREIAERNKDKVVINNIRNKLAHRIFAIVKSGKEYQKNYLNPLANCA